MASRSAPIFAALAAAIALLVATAAASRAQTAPTPPDAKPWLSLGAIQPISAYGRESPGAQPTEAGAPLSLASADFDEDGFPDIAYAVSSAHGSLATVLLGDPAAREASGAFPVPPFRAPDTRHSLPVAADFLAAGDFDGDGHADLLAAAQGAATLAALPGAGGGDFGAARLISLPGAVTALAVGEINRPDGKPDLVIAVAGQSGAEVLVYEHPNGTLNAAPESIPMPAPVAALAFAELDGAFGLDLAIAAGDQVLIAHGRDRKLTLAPEERSQVPPARMTSIAAGAPVAGLAAGDFTAGKPFREELAVLTADGELYVVDPASGRMLSALDLRVSAAGGVPLSRPRLLRVKSTSLPTDDLLWIDPASRQARLIGTSSQDTPGADASAGLWSIALSDAVEIGPPIVAAAPLRLNKDALSDLVVLRDSPEPLAVIPTEPASLLVVVSAGDHPDYCDTNPGNGTCNPGQLSTTTGECLPSAQACTLRVAILEANAHAGADEIQFSYLPGVLQPVAALPHIADPLTIDGSTNPSAARTQLGGGSAGAGVNGFMVHTHHSVIRGMVIQNFHSSGILNGFGIGLVGNDNIVEGNYLGTDKTGATAQPNDNGGVVIGAGTARNTVGGTVTSARNLISGNYGHGVQVGEPTGGSMSNAIQGNVIGLNAARTGSLSNWETGVIVGKTGSMYNLIGGGAGRNIISRNWDVGVCIQEGASGNLVTGNYIGVDEAGALDLGNLAGGVIVLNAPNNAIGSTAASDRNTIAANGEAQVIISHEPATQLAASSAARPATRLRPMGQLSAPGGAPVDADAAAPEADSTGNTVQGNYVGVKVSGMTSGGLNHTGVLVENASGNTIGGHVSGAGNLISRNAAGVVIYSSVAAITQTANTVAGNKIGTDPSGTRADEDATFLNGNEWGNVVGVVIENTAGNTVGGTGQASRNLISGNLGYGVLITGTRASSNRVLRNRIGSDLNGNPLAAGVGWALAGVWIDGGSGNLIGGSQALSNTIAYGLDRAIVVAGGERNDLRRNSIFSNRGLPIDLGDDGSTPNDPGDPDPGANLLQNTPVITGVTGRLVTGTLNSISNTAYSLEFYAYEVCQAMPGGHLADQFVLTSTVTTNEAGNRTFTVTLPSALPDGYFVSATATDPRGNTSEFSNPPIELRASSSAYLPAGVFTPGHTLLLYTVIDPYLARLLEPCLGDLEFYVVADSSPGQPIPLNNNGLGGLLWSEADFILDDAHLSAWFTPTSAATTTLALYVTKNGDTQNAIAVDLLKLSPEPQPELLVLTDFRALFDEFNDTVTDSSELDVNGNQIRDFYDAVQRVREYAAAHRGVVVDARQDAYGPDDYDYAAAADRAKMPPAIDRLIRFVPTATLKYVAVVGDDAVVPFYRYPDSARPTSERCYQRTNTCTIAVDHGVEAVRDTQANFILTDVPYSTSTDAITRTPDIDWGLGRVFASAPLTLTWIISGYEQPVLAGPATGSAFVFNIKNERDAAGAVTFGWQANTRTMADLLAARGYVSASFQMADRGKPLRRVWYDQEDGWQWEPIHVALSMAAPAAGGRLTVLNTHASHLLNTTPVVTSFVYTNIESLAPFPGSVFVNVGCHGGYATGHDAGAGAAAEDYYRHALVRAALERQLTYHASTTYGQTTAGAVMRYNDRIHYDFLDSLAAGSATIGDARRMAQQRYYDSHAKAGFNDRDVVGIYGTELYGLPTQPILRLAAGGAVVATLGPLPAPSPLQAAGAMTLSLRAPNFRVTRDALGRALFEAPGGGQVSAVGDGPLVPLLIRSVYLPAGTTGIQVTLVASETAPYSTPVILQPQRAGDRSHGVSEVPYAGGGPYPLAPYWTNVSRDAGGIRLTISAVPLVYQPATGQVMLIHRLDFQIAFSAPSSAAAIGAAFVGQAGGAAVNQPAVPITVVVTSDAPRTATLRWLIADAGNGTLRGGSHPLTLASGANQVAWSSDSLGWLPGEKVLHLILEDESGQAVAASHQAFAATGHGLALSSDKGVYGPADARVALRAEVRDASGAEVPGLVGGLAQTLDGAPIALAWQPGGSYTAALNLAALPSGRHLLRVTTTGGGAADMAFTIDRTPPTSTARVPNPAYGRSFTVTLSGEDDLSGAQAIRVQYRVGPGGTWTDWLTRSSEWDYEEGGPAGMPAFGPLSPVAVTEGITYYFRTRAVDAAGNIEAIHAAADAWTTVRPRPEVRLPLIFGQGSAQSANRFVSRVGTDSGDCGSPARACRTLQYAIDQAASGELIAVAGYEQVYTLERPSGSTALTYWEVQRVPRPEGYYGPDEIAQVAFIDKSVTLRGGYSPDFADWDPARYKTVLRPGQNGREGRVVTVAPYASPILEWLVLMHGDATDLGGEHSSSYGYQDAGGGLYALGASSGGDTITIRHCDIVDNVASMWGGPADGGGVFLDARHHALLTGNRIYSNTAAVGYGSTLGQGGGVFIRFSNGIQLVDNTIDRNAGSRDGWAQGGGVNLYGATNATVQGNRIRGNVGTRAGGRAIGGGIYLNNAHDAVLSSNLITGNAANLAGAIGSGGGLSLYQTRDALISRNTIHGNLAAPASSTSEASAGGGVRLAGATRGAMLVNNVIAGNLAPYGGGGVLLIASYSSDHVSATLIHNTIADNGVPVSPTLLAPAQASPAGMQAGAPGGFEVAWLAGADGRPIAPPVAHSAAVTLPREAQGIQVYSEVTLRAYNTIVSGHQRGVYEPVPEYSDTAFTDTLWHANAADADPTVARASDHTGNPAYVNPATGDYHIGAASAARDVGGAYGVADDIDGQARPWGSGYDPGADEYTGGTARQ